jgi:beta-N-acetylhexosaminidase
VQRFKKGFTRIPAASAIGAAGSPKLAFEIAEVMARGLAAVGINLNFAPVVDIFTHAKNAVIETRAFAADEDTVSKMSSGTVRGHLVHGVVPCAKHFPGHGDTSTDSHHALPQVNAPRETLEARELRPFQKAIKARCPVVMTAHVLYPALDPDRPATLSRKIVTELLRGEMRFSRLVVTDDLGMKAITDHCALEDAPRLALEAGCDLLLYAREDQARKAYATLSRDLESGRLDPKLVMAAYDRIASVKHEYLKKPARPVEVSQVGQVVGISSHQEVVAKIPESGR